MGLDTEDWLIKKYDWFWVVYGLEFFNVLFEKYREKLTYFLTAHHKITNPYINKQQIYASRIEKRKKNSWDSTWPIF